MADLQFGDLIFEESLISARDIVGGGELTFTRAERAVLSALMAQPRRVLSRNALLDSMSGIGSDTSDRNVDFVINRLRLKLGDPARSPPKVRVSSRLARVAASMAIWAEVASRRGGSSTGLCSIWVRRM